MQNPFTSIWRCPWLSWAYSSPANASCRLYVRGCVPLRRASQRARQVMRVTALAGGGKPCTTPSRARVRRQRRAKFCGPCRRKWPMICAADSATSDPIAAVSCPVPRPPSCVVSLRARTRAARCSKKISRQSSSLKPPTCSKRARNNLRFTWLLSRNSLKLLGK